MITGDRTTLTDRTEEEILFLRKGKPYPCTHVIMRRPTESQWCCPVSRIKKDAVCIYCLLCTHIFKTKKLDNYSIHYVNSWLSTMYTNTQEVEYLLRVRTFLFWRKKRWDFVSQSWANSVNTNRKKNQRDRAKNRFHSFFFLCFIIKMINHPNWLAVMSTNYK